MKNRDTITNTICVATALLCIILTFWGNWKNDGVITTDAYIGVMATFIGVCATIIVGFQIISFVKVQDTERQIKKVQAERIKMQKDKEALQREINYIDAELSNVFTLVSRADDNKAFKCIAYILSIYSSNITAVDGDVTLNRYESLMNLINDADDEERILVSKYKYKLDCLDIPKDTKNYNKIMKLHFEIIDILNNVRKSNIKV